MRKKSSDQAAEKRERKKKKTEEENKARQAEERNDKYLKSLEACWTASHVHHAAIATSSSHQEPLAASSSPAVFIPATHAMPSGLVAPSIAVVETRLNTNTREQSRNLTTRCWTA
jgi:hypothetical protein